MSTTIGQLAAGETREFADPTPTSAADPVLPGSNPHSTAAGWAKWQRFQHQFGPTRYSNGARYAETAPKKLAMGGGCAGCSRYSGIDDIRDVLLRTENPETDHRVLRILIKDLKTMHSEEAAEILVDFLAIDIPARYDVFQAAVEALMQMGIGENLKIKGCENLLGQPITEFAVLNYSIQALQAMDSEEAAEVLVDFLATDIPARLAALSKAMYALMQMGVHENLKVKGLENVLGQGDPFVSLGVMGYLEGLEGDEANRLLAKIADPDSPYHEIRQQAQEEVDKRFKKHFELGDAHAENMNFDAAIVEFEKALLLKRNDSKALYNLGVLYHKKLECKKALKYLEAVQLPDNRDDRVVSMIEEVKDCIKYIDEIQKKRQE